MQLTTKCLRCSEIFVENFAIYLTDWKLRTLSNVYDSREEQLKAYSDCHLRSAHRILLALLANGGIFVKLGQHVSSLSVSLTHL